MLVLFIAYLVTKRKLLGNRYSNKFKFSLIMISNAMLRNIIRQFKLKRDASSFLSRKMKTGKFLLNNNFHIIKIKLAYLTLKYINKFLNY